MATDSVIEAQKLFREALDASLDQRHQIEEDLAFSDASDPQQWEPTIKRQRENDPGGERPCYVFDQVGQYVSNVTGQIQQQPPSLHAIPVDGGADVKVAEHLDGFFRHIEYSSRAQQHYSRALQSAARCGVGYLTVRPEHVNRALNHQEPRIGSEGDPLRVVFDPWSVELDGSDATYGFLLSGLSKREFVRRWKGADAISFGDTEQRAKDERESVIVAEQWHKVTQRRRMLQTVVDGDETDLSEQEYIDASNRAGVALPIVGEYFDSASVVKWSLMSGVAVLEAETEYPASGIGIVPVYGYVAFTGGRMRYCGMPRRAMAPQRAYNYHASEMLAYIAQAPKAPWTVPLAAIAGLETLWDRASIEARAYLPWRHMDETGQPIPRPERTALAVNMQNHMAGAEAALRDIQASLGMYQANLGAPSNETSGVAIESRKQQGEASTADFPAHMQASIGQVGRLCMDMIPRLIDSRRQVRIIGMDDSSGSVVMDPKAPQPQQEVQGAIVVNPNIGRYDVRVVVGASYSTQRAQAQAAFTEMMRAAPQLMPAIAPLWAKTLDVPYADKLAQALTAIAPAEVQAVLKPQGEQQGPSQAEMAAQLQQLQAAVQEATELAQQAEQELAEAQAKLEDKTRENEIREYDAETKRLQVTGANEQQVQAIVMQLLSDMGVGMAPAYQSGGIDDGTDHGDDAIRPGGVGFVDRATQAP